MTNLNNRRFTLAPGRPAACVYRLPVRATYMVVRPAPLRLDWLPDPVTGVPTARWVRDEGEVTPRCAPSRHIFRLAA